MVVECQLPELELRWNHAEDTPLALDPPARYAPLISGRLHLGPQAEGVKFRHRFHSTLRRINFVTPTPISRTTR